MSFHHPLTQPVLIFLHKSLILGIANEIDRASRIFLQIVKLLRHASLYVGIGFPGFRRSCPFCETGAAEKLGFG